MKRGDYYKLVGDYAGAVWTGRRWERFDCQRCVILAGIAKGAPLQGPPTPGAAAALRMPVVHRHDAARHGAWLLARNARNSALK